ncbi:c-type cytochrome [Hyphomicrobium sp. CS1GBMeth3]|uniref:c-type cytochrome n=1 Tax=Hyphomicrobium sp. CS1GBMeth3 TaxID=1892845 RepID=UPI0009F9317E|nr:c-type cytochrome [Hyphomicrobium sp. CS1GBMeth3]
MRLAMIAAAFALYAVPAPALAQQLGNAEKGLAYARAHCGECHGVEREAEDFSPNADAPDFSVVANTPGMTERALAVWLQTSHPTMPNLIVPEEARDDVIAYIMSLKAPKP